MFQDIQVSLTCMSDSCHSGPYLASLTEELLTELSKLCYFLLWFGHSRLCTATVNCNAVTDTMHRKHWPCVWMNLGTPTSVGRGDKHLTLSNSKHKCIYTKQTHTSCVSIIFCSSVTLVDEFCSNRSDSSFWSSAWWAARKFAICWMSREINTDYTFRGEKLN